MPEDTTSLLASGSAYPRRRQASVLLAAAGSGGTWKTGGGGGGSSDADGSRMVTGAVNAPLGQRRSMPAPVPREVMKYPAAVAGAQRELYQEIW